MPGTGLGLAIVKDIAEAWAAELSFETTGSRFPAKLSVPAQEAAVVRLDAAREA